tara:strand:- start:1371 stop:1556 length:186 start_codon:yes stop_codon:yes gene_type:complete
LLQPHFFTVLVSCVGNVFVIVCFGRLFGAFFGKLFTGIVAVTFDGSEETSFLGVAFFGSTF